MWLTGCGAATHKEKETRWPAEVSQVMKVRLQLSVLLLLPFGTAVSEAGAQVPRAPRAPSEATARRERPGILRAWLELPSSSSKAALASPLPLLAVPAVAQGAH
jgi:hypothetical protein